MKTTVKWTKIGAGEYEALNGRVRTWCPTVVDPGCDNPYGGVTWFVIVDDEVWTDRNTLRDVKKLVAEFKDDILNGGR